MIKLAPRFRHCHEIYPDDVNRIVAVFRDRGYEITREDAGKVWSKFSEMECREEWAAMPRSDDELIEEIYRYCWVVE